MAPASVPVPPGTSNVMKVGACEKQLLASKKQTAPARSVVCRKRERFSELLAIGVVVV
jgi:hypothetical protein